MSASESASPDIVGEVARRVADLDEQQAMALVNEAIASYPQNAKLYFLRGSLHAEAKDYPAALADFRLSNVLDGAFPIARFQLGLLLLCLGNAVEARRVWAPLDELAEDDVLRLFKQGLCLLADEHLADGIEYLKSGQTANHAYPPLNRDIQLLIDRAEQQLACASDPPSSGEVHLLLSGYLGSSTKH